jgi:hypothetical protein
MSHSPCIEPDRVVEQFLQGRSRSGFSKNPTEVFIDQKANLPKPSFVQADNLHAVPKKSLGKYVGTLDFDTMCRPKLLFTAGEKLKAFGDLKSRRP